MDTTGGGTRSKLHRDSHRFEKDLTILIPLMANAEILTEKLIHLWPMQSVESKVEPCTEEERKAFWNERRVPTGKTANLQFKVIS